MAFNGKEIAKILRQSFVDSFKWKIWKWLITGSIGAFSATLQVGQKFFQFDTSRSIRWGLLAIAGLFVLRFFLVFCKESLKYYHEVYHNSSYGDAIIILKDSFSKAHNYRKTPGHRDEEFMKIMILFCDNLKSIFDKLTRSECSVSIKVPLHDENVREQAILQNLTRDVQNAGRDTEKYKSTSHSLIGNTCFAYTLGRVLTNTKEKYYINNDTNGTENYANTSKACYTGGILPYNSELVVPIVPIENNGSKSHNCLGFICVDSKIKKAFSTQYQVPILEGVADGIYDMISERNKNKIQKPRVHEQTEVA